MPLFVHKDLLPAPAQSVAPCWGPACVQEQVISSHCPQLLPPNGCRLRQLVSWDGGRLGFACAVGWSYRPGPGAQGRGRAAAHVGEHGPSGNAPPPLRSDLEGVESGWGDGDPVRRRKGVHVRTGALGGRSSQAPCL